MCEGMTCSCLREVSSLVEPWEFPGREGEGKREKGWERSKKSRFLTLYGLGMFTCLCKLVTNDLKNIYVLRRKSTCAQSNMYKDKHCLWRKKEKEPLSHFSLQPAIHTVEYQGSIKNDDINTWFLKRKRPCTL